MLYAAKRQSSCVVGLSNILIAGTTTGWENLLDTHTQRVVLYFLHAQQYKAILQFMNRTQILIP